MNTLKFIFAFFLISLQALPLMAQEREKHLTKDLLESKKYVFSAESVNPQRGSVQYLTSGYDLVIKGDTVVASLPFFGRAYSAPISTDEAGIKFISTEFEYAVVKRKKNRWEIRIKPKDTPEVQELFLTIFNNNKASLRINSVRRESISYNGFIKEGKQRDKKAI
ncbi:MAG: DUF4251 domain-containing protein [Chitinophagaceae bacterium]